MTCVDKWSERARLRQNSVLAVESHVISWISLTAVGERGRVVGSNSKRFFEHDFIEILNCGTNSKYAQKCTFTPSTGFGMTTPYTTRATHTNTHVVSVFQIITKQPPKARNTVNVCMGCSATLLRRLPSSSGRDPYFPGVPPSPTHHPPTHSPTQHTHKTKGTPPSQALRPHTLAI